MAMGKELVALIRKYAVKNAIDYGKADTGSVLGKVIPNAKGTPIPEIRAAVEHSVKEVNRMEKAALEAEYENSREEFVEKAKETAERTAKPKMELEGAVIGSFITRFPPEPSGYLHIGHAKPIFLEQEFVKMYKGKLYLYFDDTNPEKETQEYVEADKRDLEWLGIKFDGEYYASDHLDTVYEYAKKLIKEGNAYVCTCDQEKAKKMRLAMEECEHRKRKPALNLSEFNKMLGGEYEEGQAVLRFKGDMKADNTTMRDPAIARIKKTKHYRQGDKYPVWPTYDLAAPILDSTKGVTHVMRSKEYELRDELDTRILEKLGLRVPKICPFSRLNVIGNTTHKREIRKLISEHIIERWDDPRLMTLIALKRRGIMPEAIREFALRNGMSKSDSEVPLEMLLAENKKIIDAFAKHLYFVSTPKRLRIEEGIEGDTRHAKMRLHPSAELGFREYDTGNSFLIDGADYDVLKKGSRIRLKDLVDIEITATGSSLVAAMASSKEKGSVVQWVPEKDSMDCTILVPGQLLDEKGNLNKDSLKTVEGRVEGYAKNLKEHEIVQFERFGYCILDDKKKMRFIFISK